MRYNFSVVLSVKYKKILAIVPSLEYNIRKRVFQMEYMTAKEAATKWGISHRRVITLCGESRIENAKMIGNMWVIPADAEKPYDGRKSKGNQEKDVKPFIKWAGGKGQLLPIIRRSYPKELGKSIKKYCEPMVGAGAVLFDILNNYSLNEILICDSNTELINVYRVIQKKVSALIELLSKFEKEYLALNDEERKKYYYAKRAKYNSIMKDKSQSVLRATLFIFLNKTCFNGLYRVNANGLYNVPMGSYKNPTICNSENLIDISAKLAKVKIISGDYKKVNSFVDSSTFVYFDPPYRPLSKTASFTGYTEGCFDDKEQIRLAKFIKSLSNRGAFVLTSNSDPKNTDKNDTFFDDLYCSLSIKRIPAKRSINSNGNDRGIINELLISNY